MAETDKAQVLASSPRAHWIACQALCALLAVGSVSAHVRAQSIRVQLVRSDGISPARGKVVEATGVTAVPRVIRGSVSAAGVTVLAVAISGRYRLRVLSVGFVPEDLGEVVVKGDSVTTVSFALRERRISLDSIRVVSKGGCDAVREADAKLLTAIDQARVLVRSVPSIGSDQSIRVYWRLWRVIADGSGTPLTPAFVRYLSTIGSPPFQSVGTDSLLSAGFVVQREREIAFRAPDAGFLLSSEFTDSQCFGVATQSTQSDSIGIEFAPFAERRHGAASIAGTMWFDAGRSTLRSVQFRFVRPAVADGGPEGDGELRFAELPGRGWLIQSWYLRMPRETAELDSSGMSRITPRVRLVVNAFEIIAGIVDSVTFADGAETVHFLGSPAGVRRIGERAGSPGRCESPAAGAKSDSAALYGMILDSLGLPLRDRVVRATWMPVGGSRFSRDLRVSREFKADDGFFLFCGVPIDVTVRLEVVGDRHASSRAAVRTGEQESGRPVLLRVPR